MVNKAFCKLTLTFLLILFGFVLFSTAKINDLKTTIKSIELEQEKKMKIINKIQEIFTELYLNFRNKVSIITNYNEYNLYENNSKKVALCSIGKDENLYAKEFVEYYLSLGFDKIIILDNNDLKGEKFDDILKPYIENNFVEIKDLRGIKQIQIPAFNYLYDWIAFFDFDEFLFIKNSTNLKDYIYSSRFKKCQQVLFNWYIYNDNDLLKYDNRTMIDRFTQLAFFPGRTKFIVRGNISNLIISASHIAINSNYCNSKGEIIYPKSYSELPKENNSIAFLKHFYTKTAQEYCMKRKRGYAQTLSKQNQKLNIDEINAFFRYNRKTPEKIKIFEKCNNPIL